MEEERLQKFIANQGVCSRRKAEEYILEGRVKVNNKVITELGTKITPNKDVVQVNGKTISNEKEKKVYILLNKPIGYVTTTKDQFNRDTVLNLVKIKEKVLPVGRLDMYTSGAIILTNDGDFIYKVTHPKYEIEKTYNATVKGQITDEEVEKLRNGVEIAIEDETTKMHERRNLKDNEKRKLNEQKTINKTGINVYKTGKAKVKILKIDKEKDISRIEITIHEGKNREVRKMCEAVGRKVLALHRTKIGNIDVKNLKLGTWRYLTQKEVKCLIDTK